MRPLRPGQDTVISWSQGAVECRVIAAAGSYALLHVERFGHRANETPSGACSLTYLDGLTPMGWDGFVETAAQPREVRFRLAHPEMSPERRSTVRLPVSVPVEVTVDGDRIAGQSLDVSAGGLRFRHPAMLAPGRRIHVVLELPDGPRVDTDAVVRKTEKGLSSVEFSDLGKDSWRDIGVWTVGSLRAALTASG